MMTDLAIVGAGPAGLAAAAKAAELGVSCTLIDEQATPGGQIYRAVTAAQAQLKTIMGADYAKGAALAACLSNPAITYRPGCTLWQIDRDNRITFSGQQGAEQLVARHILLATGALERPIPIPGWTLPGVMAAGGAQILLKQSGLLAENAVLAGCGPLLYLLATQMIRAGHPPRALVELQDTRAYLSALAHLPKALRHPASLRKGQEMLRAIRKASVPRYVGAQDLRVQGDEKVDALSFRHKGKTHALKTDLVLLHAGVVPNIQITSALGLAHRWQSRNHCFEPEINCYGAVADRAIHIAGDGAAILGADAAALSGTLAALDIAHRLDRLNSDERDRQAAPLLAKRRKEQALRPLLEILYRPPQEVLTPADDTIICRCEEVPARTIRRIADAGCAGPNQAKAYCRAGMGPCQGRYCGQTTTQLLAQATGRSPDDIGYLNQRFPTKPVTLKEIATLHLRSP